MKKKLAINKISTAYSLLDGAKYTKMEAADRRALVKAMRPFKKVANDFADFREDAIKRLRPDNYEEVAQTINEFNSLTVEERKAAVTETKYADALKVNMKFNGELEECLREEAVKEVEVEYEPLSETAIDRLLDSNLDWTVGQSMLVEDIIGA